MRWLPPVALLLCCCAVPACAQHGGFRGGAGHGGGGFRGGLGAGGVRGGFGLRSPAIGLHLGGPGLYRGPTYGVQPSPRFYGSRFYAPGPYGRSGYLSRGPRFPSRRPFPYRRSYIAGGVYPGVVGFGYAPPFWDFADGLTYSQPYDLGQPAYPEGDANVSPYPYQAGEPYGPTQGAPPAAPYANDSGQPRVYAPYPYAYQPPPQITVVTLPPPQREEDAVTIFYRDGRAPEQIRNYALTRSALLVTGDRLRMIPLADIDVPLTERVNRAAGVDFRLPEAN